MTKIQLARLRRRIKLYLTPPDEMAGNRLTIIGENCANSVTANLVGGNFLTGLMLLLNAGTVELGLVNILTYVANLAQLLSPLLLERFRQRKRILICSRVIVHILNVIMIGLVAALPLGERLRVLLILGIIAVQNLASGLTSPGFSVWHMQSIPDRERANYFSMNQRAVNVAAYIFILTGGAFADSFKAADRELLGFLILRGVAILFAALDIWTLTKIKEYDYPKGEPVNLKLLVTAPFQHREYLLSVLIVFLWNFFANTTGSYYSVYMLQDLGVSYSFLNLVSAMYVPVVLFLSPRWARYINHTSWLSVYWKALLLYGLFYLGHSFVGADCIWLYPVVVIFCFLMSPAINLVMANMSFYRIPRKNQTVYLSFCSAVSMLAAILGNLFATRFMLLTEGVTFRLLSVPMKNGQFLPFITGCLILLLGGIVYFISRADGKRPGAGESGEP